MNNYVIYRGETEPLNKGCIWIHHENGDLNAPLIASVYRDGVWINKLDDTSSSDVVRECCPKESEDTIIYRGEDEPSNKKCIWIHHTIPYDTTSPLIAQVYINGEWVDKTEEFSDTPYIKPIDGIPERDLSAEVQEKLNSGYTKEELDEKFEIVNNDIDNLEDTKVDKIEGKGLSTEDYTTEEKAKLNGIQSGAEVNVNADWNATSGDAEILNKPDLSVYATKASVSDIEALIPSQASTNNKLADKDFVNSSISTNTAEFQGTYSSVSDLENITDADINDYAFVISVDSSGNTVYNRYKYNGTSWIYEYSLNNSSFTAAQWAAIQSGITASLVSKLTSLPTNTELNDLLSNKVDKVSGKGLSTNDYTTAEKTKLSGIETNAQVNILEGVKVNGTDLPINNKKVDITISDIATDLGTELKENQEFVFRQTADGTLTKDYSVEYIKSIKGKSLAWNQLAKRLFSSSVQNGVTVSADADNNAITFAGTPSSYSINGSMLPLFIVGHKYFYSHKIISNPNNLTIEIGLGNQGRIAQSTNADFHVVFEASTIGNGWGYVGGARESALDGIKVCVNMFDLTLMFGAGNEPSTVEEFEAMFPLSYYDYNAGTLISNDAESLETVGFNQWDEEWESGKYNTSGIKATDATAIRSTNYIPCLPNTEYYIRIPAASNVNFYDAEKKFISYAGKNRSGTFTSPANARYITFYIASTTTYNNDICISLSDPTKNGTYEPYWKRVLPVNCDSFKVKSHNIWDEEWEIGNINGQTGEKQPESSRIRSKNLFPAFGGVNYYMCIPSPYKIRAFYYDANKNFISAQSGYIDAGIITTPANCAYMLFSASATYGAVYNNDICINVSSSFNGNYEPHGILTKTGGLKGAGSAYDEKSDKYYERIGSVDLGTLDNWNKQTDGGSSSNKTYFRTAIKGRAIGSSMNILCSRYVRTSGSISRMGLIDKTIGQYNTTEDKIAIMDSSYDSATAEEFKAAMSGVMLYYELATPIEYELAEPIMSIKTDRYGTERIYHSDTTLPCVPMKADIQYGTDSGDISDENNKLFNIISELIKRIETLENQ